ncbi:asparagine synthase-related protein [Saccharothrix obliqua]|uniref:asparagine synthase-related protein n=1 Tax=Saccharothrix obliqua TaxID=2861747 RepID=UPI001C5E831A|nr:asparagine synthase-related protein [Saccharothrix obliqua]MBW4719107.1 asparagine synthase [Saccharothrix obliqua]
MRGFLVFPDAPAAEHLAAGAPGGVVAVRHRSGRPWLVTWGTPEPVVSAHAGEAALVVVGFCPVTAARLTELARGVRSVGDVDRVAHALPGSAHLIAAVDGHVRVQGTLAGLRRVLHTRAAEDVPVAGDRADLLASLTGAGVDTEALAVRVVCGDSVPAPLGEQSMWRRVTAVPPGHYVVLGRRTSRVVRWWTPPDPELPLAAGAAVVRDALVGAMAVRPGRLSADLSGGLDSTSLCFLAAHHQAPDLLTVRVAVDGPEEGDPFFAAHARRALPDARHLVLDPAELPALHTDPGRAIDSDHPTACSRTDAQQRHISRLLADRGYHHHLTGNGGDELFLPPHGYLTGLPRHRPLEALRHIRAQRALSHWPLVATARGLVRRGTLRDWWKAQADELTGPPVPDREPDLGWGLDPLRAGTCATPEAIATTRAALRRTARQVTPLAADPGQHQALLAIRSTAPGYHQLAALYAEQGVFLDLPYLDDAVVVAVSAVQLHQRSTPWRYKQLLGEAMRGIMPEVIRNRGSKDDFSGEAISGLHHNMSVIRDLFTRSTLVEHGLVDAKRLQRLIDIAPLDATAHIALEDLIACETWLVDAAARSARPRVSPSGAVGGSGA